MASKTEVCNIALSHLGIGKEVANIDTEQSQEASACRRYYETAKEATLADLDWPFATKEAVLNLISANPTSEWDYSYRYPVDCITLRRIKSGKRSDTQSSRVPFKILKDAAGKIIYTDKQSAEVEYTENINDPSYFSADFIMAFSFKLAAYLAPRLTKGDPFKLKQEMLQQYILEISMAKKRALNEEVNEEKPESQFITVRG